MEIEKLYVLAVRSYFLLSLLLLLYSRVANARRYIFAFCVRMHVLRERDFLLYLRTVVFFEGNEKLHRYINLFVFICRERERERERERGQVVVHGCIY